MGNRQAAKHLALVAEIAADLRETEERPGTPVQERGRRVRWKKHAAALEEFVKRQSSAAGPAAVDMDDISDLPPALLKELSVGDRDPLEKQIIAVLRSCGGSADLDRLLIGLYRKFETIQKRRFLQNKLWRMVRKGDLHKAKDARGLFCLEPRKTQKRTGRRGK